MKLLFDLRHFFQILLKLGQILNSLCTVCFYQSGACSRLNHFWCTLNQLQDCLSWWHEVCREELNVSVSGIHLCRYWLKVQTGALYNTVFHFLTVNIKGKIKSVPIQFIFSVTQRYRKSSMAGASQWRIYYHRMWGQLSTTCSNYWSSPMGNS